MADPKAYQRFVTDLFSTTLTRSRFQTWNAHEGLFPALELLTW